MSIDHCGFWRFAEFTVAKMGIARPKTEGINELVFEIDLPLSS
jgi:hypothetical protein